MQLGNRTTDWFPVPPGVRQGDSLSPTLFAVYINDLAEQVNSINSGIKFGGEQLSILMYADDLICLAPDENKLQMLLDVVTVWCDKWLMKINPKKTQVMHVRNYQRARSNNTFK